MITIMVTHEVNDVKHWLASTKREEIFGPMGTTLKTFVDPAGSKMVGLVGNIPDMAAFQKFMETQTVADAMKQDGVLPATLKMFVASLILCRWHANGVIGFSGTFETCIANRSLSEA